MSEVEEVMTDLMGVWDEESVLERQSNLHFPPPQTNPENVADGAMLQEAVDCRPREQGGKRQRPQSPPPPQPRSPSRPQEPHLPVGPQEGPTGGSCGQLPGPLDHGQGNMTPSQQALHVARQALQSTRTDVEIFRVVRALSLALGSTRTESGTIKAVHAVLLDLDRPGMTDREASARTGASLSNFKKWRKRVQHAQFGLPPP